MLYHRLVSIHAAATRSSLVKEVAGPSVYCRLIKDSPWLGTHDPWIGTDAGGIYFDWSLCAGEYPVSPRITW